MNGYLLDGDIADPEAGNAQIFDLAGRLVVSPSLTKGDLLYLLPHFQVSRNDGDPTETLYAYDGGDSLILQRPLFPSDFTQLGAALAYYFPLFRGQAFLGAGVEIYRRWYDEFSSSVRQAVVCEIYDFGCIQATTYTLSPDKRRDTYIEPTAHLIFPNVFGPNVDLRFDYRYEHNASNASTTTQDTAGNIVEIPADFQNHVAGVHVVGRY